MLPGSSSQALRKPLAQKVERWPRFVQGRELGELVIQDFVGVPVLEGKFEISLASLRHRAGLSKGGKKLGAGLETQSAENIVAIAIALVNRGCGGAGSLGDGAHGQGFFSALGPQAAGRFQDALFELGIGLSGQRLDSGVKKDQCRGPK
jgi:hypothetical protein